VAQSNPAAVGRKHNKKGKYALKWQKGHKKDTHKGVFNAPFACVLMVGLRGFVPLGG